MEANRIAQDGTTHFAASHLGLFCLYMFHKKDTMILWVNWTMSKEACLEKFAKEYDIKVPKETLLTLKKPKQNNVFIFLKSLSSNIIMLKTLRQEG